MVDQVIESIVQDTRTRVYSLLNFDNAFIRIILQENFVLSNAWSKKIANELFKL